MSVMGLNQLVTQETGAERKTSGPGQARSDDRGSDVNSQEKPSRYEDVARQQEKRLEQRRQHQRAGEKTAEADIRQEKQARAKASEAAAKESRRDTAGKASPDDKDAGASSDAVARTGSERPGDARGRKDVSGTGEEPAGEALPIAPGSDTDAVDPFAFFGLTPVAADAEATVMPASTTTASGLASGPGQPLSPNAIFSALLEGGPEGKSTPKDLLAGLQGSGLQALAPGSESGAKPADLLTAQLATRLGAPEAAAQQLNNPGAMKGMDAQAMMRSYTTSVDVPVAGSEWGEKVMGKLAWLTASQMSVAEIHITPPELGPLDVRVQVQNDQATVTVHASTPAVREQLELHGHRLRDMLSEQGISLEGFDVSDSGGQQAGEGAEGEGDGGSRSGQQAGTGEDPGDQLGVQAGELDLSWKGEVDLYA